MEYRVLDATGLKQTQKYFNEIQKHSYSCKCGHRIVITNKTKKSICNWCGRTVYKNKKDEFMDKLGVKLYGRKN